MFDTNPNKYPVSRQEMLDREIGYLMRSGAANTLDEARAMAEQSIEQRWRQSFKSLCDDHGGELLLKGRRS